MNNLNQHVIIGELLEDNFRYASVLYDYGIDFDKYIARTLEEICVEKGLNVSSIIRQLESINKPEGIPPEIFSYSLDLVVAYLQHTHKHFVKSRMPFIAKLIERADAALFYRKDLAEDLKLIFPVFREDFIAHIYEEEDSLFQYVLMLQEYDQCGENPAKLYPYLRKYSINEFALEHLLEDEMEGIRKLTENYHIRPEASMHEKLILSELKSFDEDLAVHARIEDQVLLNKALVVEQSVRRKMERKSYLN